MIDPTGEMKTALYTGGIVRLLEIIDRDYVTRTIYLRQRVPSEVLPSVIDSLKDWLRGEAKYLNVTVDPDIYVVDETKGNLFNNYSVVSWEARRNG